MADPSWWRGGRPPASPHGTPSLGALRTGQMSAVERAANDPRTGLSTLYFFAAGVTGAELSLTDTHLTVEWSEFRSCHFKQRVQPVLTQAGFAAQGSLGNSPALYRACTFERIRFKTLGGFSLGQARFENCTFLNCRWEGHFAKSADLEGCRFIGPMNGCVWFGEEGGDQSTARTVRGNDFSGTRFTANVAWRGRFPVDAQTWPQGFTPLTDA